MKKLLQKFVVGLSILLFASSVWAQKPADVIRTVVDEMFSTLKAEQAAIDANPDRLIQIIEAVIVPHTDIEETSRRVLARHWNNLSAAQQQEFMTQFEQLLVHTYAVPFRSYDNQTVDITDCRVNPNNADRVEVRSEIREPGRNTIPVNYRFIRKGNDWLVYDINVAGVSLVSNYRNQASDLLNREGFDGLMAQMRAKTAEVY